MKKLIPVLLLAIIGFLAYQQYGPKQPEFKEITNVVVEEFTSKKVTFTAEAVIFNPNIIGLEVTATNLDLFVNENKAGTATNAGESVKGEPNSNFSIPLRASINPKDILKNEGLFGGLAGLMGQKQFSVLYKGYVTVKILFVEFDVPISGQAKLGK